MELPDVPGCHTYGRTIDQARARLREALSLFVAERTAAAAEFDEDIRLPKQVEKDRSLARDLRAKLEETRAQLTEVERRASNVYCRMPDWVSAMPVSCSACRFSGFIRSKR